MGVFFDVVDVFDCLAGYADKLEHACGRAYGGDWIHLGDDWGSVPKYPADWRALERLQEGGLGAVIGRPPAWW